MVNYRSGLVWSAAVMHGMQERCNLTEPGGGGRWLRFWGLQGALSVTSFSVFPMTPWEKVAA